MNKGFKILVVDDDGDVRNDVKKALSAHFEVLTATNGREGLALALQELPDLILLDIRMADMNGIKVCRSLRADKTTKNIPIIMFTAENDDELRSQAFDVGADEVISKPFRPREFTSRIVAKMKQLKSQPRPKSLLHCGNLSLDLNKFIASCRGKKISLTALEFALLTFFVRNKEQVLGREVLLEAVWKNRVVSDRVVDTSVAALRKKITDCDHQISAVYGAGYKLTSK